MAFVVSSSGIFSSRVFISVIVSVSSWVSRFLISVSRACLVILLPLILYFFIFPFRVLSTLTVSTSDIQMLCSKECI
jgi:hypothetical protein